MSDWWPLVASGYEILLKNEEITPAGLVILVRGMDNSFVPSITNFSV